MHADTDIVILCLCCVLLAFVLQIGAMIARPDKDIFGIECKGQIAGGNLLEPEGKDAKTFFATAYANARGKIHTGQVFHFLPEINSEIAHVLLDILLSDLIDKIDGAAQRQDGWYILRADFE